MDEAITLNDTITTVYTDDSGHYVQKHLDTAISLAWGEGWETYFPIESQINQNASS